MSDLKMKISRIRTGGQSGADRAAMDFAKAQGIPLCGWCPKNGWAEDYPDPPGILTDYPELTETPSEGTAQRTKWNMRDCDAILTVIPNESAFSKGTEVGLEEGARLSKPMYTAAGLADVPDIIRWLRELPDGTELCVGGPRASECAEAYAVTKAVLEGVAEGFDAKEPVKVGGAEDAKGSARRGFVPEDEKNFSPGAVRKMQTASRHILYLIDEGYDLKQATVFVGNHFLLSERQRLAIMRSLATKEQLAVRRSKQVPLSDLAGKEVWIDGFNTIISLEVLLSNSILLACMDGTIRDLAALRGTYRLIPETAEAVRLMLTTLQSAGVQKANILLDEPVSNSGRLKTMIAETGEEYSICLDIRIMKDVDRTLYEKENVISSDSIILDHCESWVNLVAECMKEMTMSGIRVWSSENVTIRPLRPDERDLLKDFLYEAIFIPEGMEPPKREIVELPELCLYYEGFGSGPADHCLVAEADGRVVGAVWTRIMNDYGHVDDETPSFAISLYPEYRGRGIGTALMRGMLELLKMQGYTKASLAVQKANYAVRMYEKVGFVTVDENEVEYIMVCELS